LEAWKPWRPGGLDALEALEAWRPLRPWRPGDLGSLEALEAWRTWRPGGRLHTAQKLYLSREFFCALMLDVRTPVSSMCYPGLGDGIDYQLISVFTHTMTITIGGFSNF
jgi:hypothetical protein